MALKWIQPRLFYLFSDGPIVRIGTEYTEEAKRRPRLARLGTKHSEETKRKIGSYHLGTKHSPETIQKMRDTYQRNHGLRQQS